MALTNILTADLDWTGRDVYIVGSGPNGNGHFEKVPDKAPTISVNKGVKTRDYNNSYWLCITPALLREEWFLQTTEFARMVENFKLAPRLVFMNGTLTETFPWIPYAFAQGRPLDNSSLDIEPGKLRRGAGSVGCALQLAQQLGAARCILVGVDMWGSKYFDDTEKKAANRPDGTWTQLSMLQKLIDHLKCAGMNVVSLSETKLNVEVVE